MSSDPSDIPPQVQAAVQALSTAGRHLRGEDSVALAAFTVLLFDHCLTFSDEIEYIWKRKMSPVSFLYLINRYFSPPAFAVSMVALFSPTWTIQISFSCHNFAKFEGVVTVVTVLIAELILLLRIFAVYERSRVILGLLGFLWIAQLCFMSFTLAHSGPVVIPPSSITYGCVLVADPKIGNLDIMFVVPTLVFDTTIFVLLAAGLFKRARASHNASSLGSLMLRDGFLYFVVVFLMNAGWTVTGLSLSSDLKNVLSFPATATTVILIGRLTLNLKMHMTNTVVPRPITESTSERSSWYRRFTSVFGVSDPSPGPLNTGTHSRTPGSGSSSGSSMFRKLYPRVTATQLGWEDIELGDNFLINSSDPQATDEFDPYARPDPT